MPLLVFLFAGQRKGLEFFCLSCHDHLPVLPSGHLRGPPPWCHVPRLRHDGAGAPSFRMSDLLYVACSPVVALAATSLVASDHCLSSGWTLGTPPHPFQRQCPSARPAHQPARPLPSPPPGAPLLLTVPRRSLNGLPHPVPWPFSLRPLPLPTRGTTVLRGEDRAGVLSPVSPAGLRLF